MKYISSLLLVSLPPLPYCRNQKKYIYANNCNVPGNVPERWHAGTEQLMALLANSLILQDSTAVCKLPFGNYLWKVLTPERCPGIAGEKTS